MILKYGIYFPDFTIKTKTRRGACYGTDTCVVFLFDISLHAIRYDFAERQK